MSDSRLEKFIYAICSMDVTDLPVPLSRIEKLWNCLITGETPDFEPLSRNEKYLMAMLDRYDISNLPAPTSRGEKLLYKIAVGETDLSDVPGYLSRYEELLKYLIENGGISGGDFEYVLHTFNQSLYTLYTTAEKPVKSAILKGQTLVNIHKLITPILAAADNDWYGNLTIASGEISFDVLSTPAGWRYINAGYLNYQMLKPNTKYLVVFESSQNLSSIAFKRGDGQSGIAQGVRVENNKAIITTNSQIVVNEQILYVNFYAEPNTKVSFKNPMIIEYQEGMENWDIPYL